jgi:drug/metabolite transporter superfamily protein YnfA
MLMSMLTATGAFIEQAFVLNSAAWFLMAVFAIAGGWLIQATLDDSASALLGTPMLVFGAAVGQHTLKEFGIRLTSDKMVNTSFGMAIGMFIAAIMFVCLMWAWGKVAQR